MPHFIACNSAARRIAFLLLMTGALSLFSLSKDLFDSIQPTARAAGSVFTVNSTGDGADNNTADNVCDDGTSHCTLRAAIQQANATPGPGIINFQIGSGPQTIRPTQRLPELTGPVVIDGAMQPGYAGAPIIELDGSLAPDGSGLVLLGGDSIVRGLVINSFFGTGIFIGGTKGGNRVEGCYIGTDITGSVARPNGNDGISTPNSNNVIGGTTPAARNVISGNSACGINVRRFCCSGDESPVTGNVIQGNYVGVNAAGDTAIPNGRAGVLITSVNSNVPFTNNLVGGAATGAGNLISGNNGNGVAFEGSQVKNNIVKGNIIGTNASLTAPLPNFHSGVSLEGSNNFVGGTGNGEGNVIAFNGDDGIKNTTFTPSTGNVLRGNSIFSNGLNNFPEGATIGIDLGPSGVTQNDAGDADAGTNDLQNFPVITSVTASASSVNVKGTLNSAASTTYDLDFYASGACNPAGNGEGARRVGSAQVTTDSGGNASFDLTFNVALSANQVFTATATDPAGNTSEFSQCAATGATAGSINFQSTRVSVNEGAGVASFVLTRTGGSAGSITVGYSVRGMTARAGSDFTATQGTFTFADGETSKSFTVPIIDDSLDEDSGKTALVSLSTTGDLDALGSLSTATLTIQDDDPLPSLSIADLSAAEGDSGTTAFDFTVTLSAVSGREVRVVFNTEDGTATGGGNDFSQPVTNGVTIPAGQTSAKLTIPVRGDTDSEPDETFFVRLFGAVNALIADGRAQGTILNDDATPSVSLSVNDVSVTEGDAGMTDAAFNVSLSGASTKTVTVDVSTSAGSAAETEDFLPVSTTLSFAPGELTKTINVPVRGDNVYERNETFTVEMRNSINALMADRSGLGTIIDDEPAPTISLGDAVVTEGDVGVTFISFPVTLSGPAGRPVGFRYRTTGDSAKPGEDFFAVENVAGFDSSLTSTHVFISVFNDTITEGDESFFLDISDAFFSGASETSGLTITRGRGVGVIRDDESASKPPTLQFDASAHTVSEDANSVTVTVTRSGDPSLAVSVDYATRSDNVASAASERNDYTPASGTLRFAAGETTKTFDVLLTDDAYTESEEFITVLLSNSAGGASLGQPAQGRINLLDNDSPPTVGNPIDGTTFFVRQHYHDFLNREPDAAGLNFWVGQTTNCGSPNLEVCRVNVSAAFFKSIEFQETGYLVERTYKTAFGDATSPNVPGTVPVIRLNEFLSDTQEIGRGIVVGQGNWQAQLEANKVAYFQSFVTRTRFSNAAPSSLSPAQFVDALFANAGVTPTAADRQAAIDEFGGASNTADAAARARALRRVAENPTLSRSELNRAFVLMEFFGYLRRNPDGAPDGDFRGWKFWLDKLNSFDGDFVKAEMVKAFIASDEYRHRFGQ